VYFFKAQTEQTMADYLIHILQAEHNEKSAKKLAFSPPFHDWGITAAFYSAIHYFESWLFYTKHKHTETSIPTDDKGKLKYTAHAWREKIVYHTLTKEGFKAFKKLRDNSEIARYLSFSRVGRSNINWLNRPASQYFKPQDAQKMVRKDLQILKRELRIDLAKLLYSLQLERKISTARLIISQILDKFKSKEEFLNASWANLKQFLSKESLSVIHKELESQGQAIRWK